MEDDFGHGIGFFQASFEAGGFVGGGIGPGEKEKDVG